jgi:hypothetical protein
LQETVFIKESAGGPLTNESIVIHGSSKGARLIDGKGLSTRACKGSTAHLYTPLNFLDSRPRLSFWLFVSAYSASSSLDPTQESNTRDDVGNAVDLPAAITLRCGASAAKTCVEADGLLMTTLRRGTALNLGMSLVVAADSLEKVITFLAAVFSRAIFVGVVLSAIFFAFLGADAAWGFIGAFEGVTNSSLRFWEGGGVNNHYVAGPRRFAWLHSSLFG